MYPQQRDSGVYECQVSSCKASRIINNKIAAVQSMITRLFSLMIQSLMLSVVANKLSSLQFHLTSNEIATKTEINFMLRSSDWDVASGWLFTNTLCRR